MPDASSRHEPDPAQGSTPNRGRPAGTGQILPDVPPELLPSSLDRERLTAEETRNAAQAITHLQAKMTAVSLELAQGKLNQSQFQALYTRYFEQKTIIERLLADDPNTEAWKAVAASGHSGYLRQQFEARVVGMLVVEIATARTLKKLGEFNLEPELLVPILTSLVAGTTPTFEAGTRSTLIAGGRWLSFVPGEFSTAIAVFSQEPSPAQIKTITNLHRDFERINRQQLMTGKAKPSQLAFPYVALFD